MIDQKQPIITLEDYKTYASIEGKKTDKTIQEYVDAASAFIKTRLSWDDDEYKEYDEWPADVKLACCQLVEYYFKDQYRASVSGGGMSISYVPGVLPRHIWLLLANYVAI